MTSVTISGFSSHDEGAAIADAIAKAHGAHGGDETPGFHIIVLGVSKGVGGWQAIALVVTDPELESTLHRRLRKAHEIAEHARTHVHKDDKKQGHHHQYHEPQDIEYPTEQLDDLDELLHHNILVYIPIEYDYLQEDLEPIAHEFSDQYDQEVHFHFIEKNSSLWESVQKMAPDYDFHKAALMEEPQAHEYTPQSDTRTVELEDKPSDDRRHPPRKIAGLQELNDDA